MEVGTGSVWGVQVLTHPPALQFSLGRRTLGQSEGLGDGHLKYLEILNSVEKFLIQVCKWLFCIVVFRLWDLSSSTRG